MCLEVHWNATREEHPRVCTPEWPHPYSTPILGVFSLHQIAHVGVSPHIGLKLFGREIIFGEFQPMWSRYLNVTDGQTDRRTIYCGIIALCVASRGKNRYIIIAEIWTNVCVGVFIGTLCTDACRGVNPGGPGARAPQYFAKGAHTSIGPQIIKLQHATKLKMC